MIEAFVYLLAIAGAEAVTEFSYPRWGLICYTVLLGIIILRAAQVNRLYYQRFILAVTLVPIFRIISISMNTLELPQLWLYLSIYALLLITTAVAARVIKYGPAEIGWRLRAPGWQLLVATIGPLLALIGYPLLRTEAVITSLTWQEAWLPVLALLFAGFVEELVFRGLIQRAAVDATGRRGIIYVSLLSSALYIGLTPPDWIPFAFFASLCFGWMAYETDSTLGVSVAHGLLNIALFLIFPFTLSAFG
jgi:membrane protease YdiL (CAAX protease family)